MLPDRPSANGHPPAPYRPAEIHLDQPEDALLAEGVRVFRRRWPIFFIVAALCVGAALAVIKWQTRIHRATSSLLVQAGSKAPGAVGEMPILGDLLGTGQGRSIQTQIEVLKSETMQRRVVDLVDEKLGIDLPDEKDPTIRVQSVRDTDLISITVDDPNRERAKAVAAQLMDTYLEQNQSLSRQALSSARQFVGKHREQIKKQLGQAEVNLKNFQEKTGAIALEEQTVERFKRSSELQSTKLRLEGELAAARASLDILNQSLRDTKPRILNSTTVTENPVVAQYRQELAKLTVEKAGLLKEFLPDSPEVQTVDARIREAEGHIKEEVSKVVAQEQETINPVHQVAQEQRVEALAREAALVPQIGALAAPIRAEEQALRAVPERGRRLIQLKRSVLSLEKVLALLEAKYHELQISEAASQPGARIIDPAKLKKKPVRPNVPLVLGFGISMGVLLGLAVMFCLEQLDNSVHSSDEVEQFFRVPVLGTVPKLRIPAGRAGASLLKQLPAAESFRMVRTSLQFASLGRPLRRVLVTSTTPGEGKSTTAIHLAAAAAQKGTRVVLIDADLRRPSLHEKLQLPNGPGLSTAIADGQDPTGLLATTVYPNLYFLPAGPPPPNPAELLDSEAAMRVFDRLLEEADLLLIDSPPCGGLADAAVLAPKCDGVVFVLKAGSTNRSQCSRALSLLRESGSRIFGVVLNHSGTMRDHYYGYGTKQSSGPALTASGSKRDDA